MRILVFRAGSSRLDSCKVVYPSGTISVITKTWRLIYMSPAMSRSNLNVKSNCVQEPTDGKKFQFLIPSFGLREHCHGYNNYADGVAHGPLHAGYTKSHI